MHIVVSWDISAADQRHTEINERLKNGIGDFSWVRPLTTFYVVRLGTEADRTAISSRLTEVAKSVTETVHIVISPVMSGGRYDGFLPTDTWPTLNERSDP